MRQNSRLTEALCEREGGGRGLVKENAIILEIVLVCCKLKLNNSLKQLAGRATPIVCPRIYKNIFVAPKAQSQITMKEGIYRLI